MNLSEAKMLYKKCRCNGFSIYMEYGEAVSKEFESLVNDKLRRKWHKEIFIELYNDIMKDRGNWGDIRLMYEISTPWRNDKELQMLSSSISKVKYANIYQKLSAAEMIVGDDKHWWKNGLIWNAFRVRNRELECKLAYQALKLLNIEGMVDEEVRKRYSQDLKRCKCIMRLLFIR